MSLENQKIVHPLFVYVLAFIFGILAKFLQLKFLLFMLSIIMFTCLILIYFFKNLEKRIHLNICLTIVFMWFGFYRFYFWEKNNTQIFELLKTKTNYSATVLDIGDHSDRFFKHKILLNIKSQEASYKFDIYVYTPSLQGIKIYDQLELIDLKINSPQKTQSFYSSEGIIPKLFINKLQFFTLNRPNFSIMRNLKEARYNLAKNSSDRMSKITKTLFEYIFLGLKNPSNLSNELRYKFNYWGIAHYLARSGLHVVMIIFLWSFLLRFIPVGFILKQVILTTLSLIYSLLTWTSVSFERALVTFLFIQLCLIMKLPIRSSYLIILCALIFLIINPIQLFFLDFQLSFALAIGISLYNELQNEAYYGLKDRDTRNSS